MEVMAVVMLACFCSSDSTSAVGEVVVAVVAEDGEKRAVVGELATGGWKRLRRVESWEGSANETCFIGEVIAGSSSSPSRSSPSEAEEYASESSCSSS